VRTGAGQSWFKLAAVQISAAVVGLGLIEAAGDDAATLAAGVDEARGVDAGLVFAVPGAAVHALVRIALTMITAAIGDAVRSTGRFIPSSMSVSL
jgi:hypothetical protein